MNSTVGVMNADAQGLPWAPHTLERGMEIVRFVGEPRQMPNPRRPA